MRLHVRRPALGRDKGGSLERSPKHIDDAVNGTDCSWDGIDRGSVHMDGLSGKTIDSALESACSPWLAFTARFDPPSLFVTTLSQSLQKLAMEIMIVRLVLSRA